MDYSEPKKTVSLKEPVSASGSYPIVLSSKFIQFEQPKGGANKRKVREW
jgi:hypothetical protein